MLMLGFGFRSWPDWFRLLTSKLIPADKQVNTSPLPQLWVLGNGFEEITNPFLLCLSSLPCSIKVLVAVPPNFGVLAMKVTTLACTSKYSLYHVPKHCYTTISHELPKKITCESHEIPYESLLIVLSPMDSHYHSITIFPNYL